MEIYPSLISSDILNLENVINLLDSYCDGYHIDVMDAHFVPNLTWGPSFVNNIIRVTNLPLDIHLMVDDPFWWINKFDMREGDTFIFHYESLLDSGKCLNLIELVKQQNVKIGIAINPDTGIDTIIEVLPFLDQVLLMSVYPGFSGQKFIPLVLDKVKLSRELKVDKNYDFKICIDGGISLENIKLVNSFGVERCGVASAIFSKGDAVFNLKELYNSIG